MWLPSRCTSHSPSAPYLLDNSNKSTLKTSILANRKATMAGMCSRTVVENEDPPIIFSVTSSNSCSRIKNSVNPKGNRDRTMVYGKIFEDVACRPTEQSVWCGQCTAYHPVHTQEPCIIIFVTEDQMEILETIKEVTSDAETPLQKVEYALSGFVSFIVLPLFALANAGLVIHGDGLAIFLHPVSLGIGWGLLAGKFLGIIGVSRLMVYLGFAELPEKATWNHIYGVALLAGVGFTMSLFITELAFTDADTIYMSKMSVLITSVFTGVLGYVFLRFKFKLPK